MTTPGGPARIPLRIKLPFATREEFVERYGVHVAAGGVFIATRSTKPEATLVSFELVLADGVRLMRGEGVVQKVLAETQPGRTGMLVRFTRIDAQTKALIDLCVAAQKGGPPEQAPHLPPSAEEPPLAAPSSRTSGQFPRVHPGPAPQPLPPLAPPSSPAGQAPRASEAAAGRPTASSPPPGDATMTPALGARSAAPAPAAPPGDATMTPALGARSAAPATSDATRPPALGANQVAGAGAGDASPTPPLPRREDDPSRTPPLPVRAAQPGEDPAAVRASSPTSPGARAPAPPAPPAAPTGGSAPVPTVQLAPGEDVVLGIDFGTTTCRVALFVEGGPRLIPIASERSTTLPSVVAFDKARDALIVGGPARRHAVEHPEQAALGFKRLLGRRARSRKVKELAKRFAFTIVADPEGDAGIELTERVFSVPELAALLLSELKNAAQDYVGRPLTRAVLCVPAWCNDYQRGAVLEAGRRAGLDVLRVLNEPSAVALAFGFGRGLARKRVLVYDLGGGTFDASVVEITGDDIDVVSTGGDAFLGGLDFDYRLAEAVIGTLPEAARERVLASRVVVERIRDACEHAKIALSEKEVAHVNVPFATTDEAGAPIDVRAEVPRGFLEEATADLVERTIAVTRMVLEAARLTPQSIDEALVVGGQSRAPAVRKALEAFLGKPARSDVDAQGAVALGAAVMGRALALADRGKRGMTLSEVLSVPIGVAVRGGGMRRVLERNTRLPTEKTLSVPVKQGEVTRLAVFQGAAVVADENEYLGAFSISAEKTGELAVQFAVSQDGRLALSAAGSGGRPIGTSFATADASDELRLALLAQAPLPGDEPVTPGNKGLLGGFKKLFSR